MAHFDSAAWWSDAVGGPISFLFPFLGELEELTVAGHLRYGQVWWSDPGVPD